MAQTTERLSRSLEGRYRILRRLGEGGMAVVYLAEDLKHRRQVALKVLRPELAASLGPERFLREIAIAARLTHPNILPLLDSGDAEGTLFYVMPYVEGESLRERLAREGQLPVDDAVKIAQRVATALGYAHGMGVVHRDIKPENILLAGGEPVVTDFGIAKAVSAAGQTKLTESGFAVGTAPYMSPEQARAEAQVDGRSDIYSLGCVLYEMLAGAPPFAGPTLHAITARKLTEPVPPLRTVRDTVPLLLEQIVFKALARLPADRYATAQQLAEALEVARTSATTPVAPVPAYAPTAPGRWRRFLPWAVAAVAIAFAGVSAWLGRGTAGEMRLSVNTPRGTEIYGFSSPVKISPDGSTIVFAAGHGDSVRLYARRLDSFETHALPGTEGGDSPFFSPDGRWVGFFARKERQLRKVAVAGGAPVTIAEDLGMNAAHGAWGTNDTIYFSNFPEPQVRKVLATGGTTAAVTHGPPPDGNWRRATHLLPDGSHALVTVTGGRSYKAHVDLVSLRTGVHQLLLDNAEDARYEGGYLLYVPYGHAEVVAVPFDANKLTVTGEPVTVLDSVAVHPDGTSIYFDVAPNGTLAYTPLLNWADPRDWLELVLVGRDGVAEPRRLPKGAGPRFSPDGRQLVYEGPGRHTTDILVYDLDRGAERHLRRDEAGSETWPMFSRDSRRVLFNSNRGGSAFAVLYSAPADGSSGPTRLPTDTTMHQQPWTWAAQGTELLYTRGPSATGMDIWAVPITGTRQPRPLMQTPANETQPAMSPDGRWLAWMTDASGRPEVMVRRYPDGPDVPVSREGGIEPAWGPGGREIYFRDVAGTRMMVASFQGGARPLVGAPRVLFTGHYATCMVFCRNYDVSSDGRRFVMVKKLGGFTETGYWTAGTEIRIVPHWDRELHARMRAAGR